MDDEVLGLGDYLTVLWRRRWVVLGIVILTAGAALASSLMQEPTYRATADVAVEPFRQGEDAALSEMILGDVTVNTEQRVMTSRPVTDRVIDELGLVVDPDELLDQVNVLVLGNTRVLQVEVIDTNPQQAADIANGYANAYLDQRREQAVDSLLAAQSTLAQRSDALQAQLDEVAAQLDGLEPSDPEPVTGGTGQDPDAPARQALEAERQALLAELTRVSLQAAQAEADAQLVQGGGRILNPAVAPVEPIAPRPLRTTMLALILGTLLGVGVAFLRDRVDDVIHDEDEASRAGSPLPVLGRIPHMDDDQRLVTLVDPSSPPAEAYRGLSANIRFMLATTAATDTLAAAQGSESVGEWFGEAAGGSDDEPWQPAWPREIHGDRRGQTLLVTSQERADGKSSTAANLAVVAARAGHRVVLVDADLRRPTIHRRFGLPAGIGLSDVIANQASLGDAVVDVGIENLWVLRAGTIPPNPAELLAAPRTRGLGRQLCRAADLVVVDGPPVLAVADTLELAPNTDAMILIVRAGVTRRRTLRDAIERLDAVGASLWGLVVNDLRPDSSASTYYAQGYQDDVDSRAVHAVIDTSRSVRRGRPAIPADGGSSGRRDGPSGDRAANDEQKTDRIRDDHRG